MLIVLVIFIMTRARSFIGFASDAKLGRPVAESLAWQKVHSTPRSPVKLRMMEITCGPVVSFGSTFKLVGAGI